MTNKQLWLDCDGVLANFDKRAFEIFGMSSKEYEAQFGPKDFWKKIRHDNDFFFNLELMPKANDLWRETSVYNPSILTGVPFGGWAEEQKVRWVKKHFNTDRIITCLSREKCLHGKPGDVLVDDTLKYKHLWEDMGGVFIFYSEDNFDEIIAEIREKMN